MLNSVITERQLLDGLLETLLELPETQVKLRGVNERPDGSGWKHDAQVDLWMGGTTTTLLVEVKKTLYPRDVRQALWRFRDFASRIPHSVFFLVAESISPGAKDLLREWRVGYYDSGGSLFLITDNIYAYVDKPPPKSMSKSIRSLFSGRRAQVLQAVLMWQGEWIRVKDLAEEARVSSATASQVLMELERFDWVVSRGQGPSKERQLRKPSDLLDTWVTRLLEMQPLAMRRYFVPLVRAEGLVEKLGKACAENEVEYAITHEAAGQLYAPFLSTISQVRCRMLAEPSTDEVLNALGARSVTQGWNLGVIEVKSSGELLFRNLVNGTWLANPVQVYLDLIRSEGRAKELAMHLRKERIGF